MKKIKFCLTLELQKQLPGILSTSSLINSWSIFQGVAQILPALQSFSWSSQLNIHHFLSFTEFLFVSILCHNILSWHYRSYMHHFFLLFFPFSLIHLLLSWLSEQCLSCNNAKSLGKKGIMVIILKELFHENLTTTQFNSCFQPLRWDKNLDTP